MPGSLQIIQWQRLRWLVGLLIIATVAAVLAHHRLPRDGWQGSEYGMPAAEFAQTHKISSTFLPIGYSAFAGVALIVFHGNSGLFAANLIVYLLWVALVWILLRQLGASARQAFFVSLPFTAYPDILFTINKYSHTALTSVMMLAFVSVMVWLLRSRTRYRADALLALVAAAAVLSRPNLLVFLPIAWLVILIYKLPHPILRMTGQALGAFILYAAVTIAVHGSVFWPQMGPYNIFAGANEYTQWDMQRSYDNAAEGSIIPALKLRGINAYHDWNKPDNAPGDNEIRNLKYKPVYMHEALKFMRTHPATMLKLTWLKFVTFFRPDLQVHPLQSTAGLIKVFVSFAFWIWLALYIAYPSDHDQASLVIALTLAAFVLPHLLTISAPHYRIPLDVLCLVSIAATLLHHLRPGRAPAQSALI